MPMHDWTRVDAGIFHDFHLAWVIELRNSLNGGMLPPNFYALAEQHAGRRVPDLITLHRKGPEEVAPSRPEPAGGVAVAEAPPRVASRSDLSPSVRVRRRTLAIRHVSGHQLVAVVEIVSPGNKDRLEHVEELAGKIDGFLSGGIHVLLIDLFPPSSHDPEGIDALVRDIYGGGDRVDKGSPYRPPCAVSYCAAPTVTAYFQPFAVGQELPPSPLFIHPERYINAPLEDSYLAAYRGAPSFVQEMLGHSG